MGVIYSIERADDSKSLEFFESYKIPKGTFEGISTGNFEDKYQIDRLLGEGSYGKVNLCVLKSDPTCKRVVKKNVRYSDKASFLHELKIMQIVSHPNILSAIEVFEDSSDHLHIVSEYFEGEELYYRVKNSTKPFEEP